MTVILVRMFQCRSFSPRNHNLAARTKVVEFWILTADSLESLFADGACQPVLTGMLLKVNEG